MKLYYAIVHKDPDSAFGVQFPDAPGRFSAAAVEADILPNAAQALRLWFEDQTITEPRGIADIAAEAKLRNGAFVVAVPLIALGVQAGVHEDQPGSRHAAGDRHGGGRARAHAIGVHRGCVARGDLALRRARRPGLARVVHVGGVRHRAPGALDRYRGRSCGVASPRDGGGPCATSPRATVCIGDYGAWSAAMDWARIAGEFTGLLIRPVTGSTPDRRRTRSRAAP